VHTKASAYEYILESGIPPTSNIHALAVSLLGNSIHESQGDSYENQTERGRHNG